MSRFQKRTFTITCLLLTGLALPADAGLFLRRCAGQRAAYSDCGCASRNAMAGKSFNSCDGKICPLWQYMMHSGYSSYYSWLCANGNGTPSNWDGPSNLPLAVQPCEENCTNCISAEERARGQGQKEMGIDKQHKQDAVLKPAPASGPSQGATAQFKNDNGAAGILVTATHRTTGKTRVAQLWEIELKFRGGRKETYYLGNEVDETATETADFVRSDKFEWEIKYKGSDGQKHSYFVIIDKH